MKTLLPLLFISILVSCSPIDDRIETSEFADKMRQIQERNTEGYAHEDFDLATQMMQLAILTGNDLIIQQRTYREFLDVIRAERLEYTEGFRKYTAKLDEYREAVSQLDIELLRAKHGYFDSDPMSFTISIANNSEDTINKIAFKVLIGRGDVISGEKVYYHDKPLKPGEATRVTVTGYARQFNSKAWGSSYFDHDLYWAEIEYFDHRYRRMMRPYPPKDPFADIR